MNSPTSSKFQGRTADHRTVRMTLMGLGVLDLLALLAVLAPQATILRIHQWCGLGAMPESPIVGYLTRSGSLLYALHGAIILFLSRDPARYQPLIRFMAWAAFIHGAAMFAIDHILGMPFWWRWTEGPGFAATGAIVLWSLARDAKGRVA